MRATLEKYLGRAAVGFVSASIFVWAVMGAETAPIPDFSGYWVRDALNLEHPVSGAGPVMSMRPPQANGQIDLFAVVGDYTNPILKPEASATVKKLGEMSLGGENFPDPSNQCAPFSPPLILQLGFQGMHILQERDQVTILYNLYSQVRRVRLNDSHPEHVTPSPTGDSVGHYEDDTLVVDTVGIRTGPLAMIDRYGTPFSESLHLVERYRLIDAAEAKAAIERHQKEDGRIGNSLVDSAYSKGLQVELRVEDPFFFTMPWSARFTHQRGIPQWFEVICAENPIDVRSQRFEHMPTADKPDF